MTWERENESERKKEPQIPRLNEPSNGNMKIKYSTYNAL